MRSRPGKGSRKPVNVKLRPSLAAEDRATARRKGKGINAKDNDSSDDEETEADRLERERFAVDEEADEDEDMLKEDDKRPLEGMTICSSGTLQLPRETIRAMCEALGATFEQVLTTETTFLLADATESDKYKACVENGIPVIQSRFIIELHRRWLEVEPLEVLTISNALRLSPLKDLRICLTGYGNDREHHRRVIADAGGAAYSPELTHEVTHLVVGPSFNSRDELLQNGKYMSAKQINNKRAKRQDGSRPIWIVWGEWLEHCLCAFGRVREEPYSAEIVSERKAIHPPPGELSQDIISRRQSASPRKMKNKNTRDDHAQIKSKRKLIKQETLPSMDVSGPTTVKRDRAAEDHSADISEKRMKLEPPATTPPGGIGDMDDSSTDALERLEPVAVKRQSPSLSADPLLSLTSNRASSLGPRPTMKKQRSSTQMELMGVQDLIAQKLEQASAPPVAGGSSNLVQHIDNGSLEDRQEGSSSGAGSRLSRMGKDRSNKFISKQKVAGQSTAEYDSDSSRTLPLPATDKKPGIEDHSAAQGQRSLEPAPTTDNDDAPPATIFSGMQFYIVPNEFPSGLVPRIEVAITARGGRVVTSDSPEVDYVMCKGVSDEPASFDLKDGRLVTSDWLEACIAYDEIPIDNPLVDVMKRPLRCALPLACTKDTRLSVAYSGFDHEFDRPKLVNLLNTLGIRNEGVIRKRDMDGHLKTTHIIIPSPDYQSTRLGTAQEWGIQVVLPQWVEQMALACPLLSPSADVSEATSADFEAEGRMAERMQENAPSSHTDMEADKPLSQCRVHISRKIQDWRDLEKLALELGARTIHVLDTDTAKSATHLIFQSNQAKPASREFNVATSSKVKVVHPDWLRQTAEKGIRQAEASYKHTRSSKRGLEVVIQSQHMSRASSSTSSKSHPDARGSDELDLPPPLKSTLSAPPSPARASAEPTSSATIASTPEKNRNAFDEYNQDNPDIINRAADDSGFIPSAGKSKDSAKRLVATSSAPDMMPDAQSEGPVVNKARNIMAEMQALMQANVSPQQLNVRLPFPQQSGYPSRTNMRKSIGRSGENGSPNGLTRSPTASNVDSTAFARRQAYSSYVETQFGQIRSDDKETQAAFDEQTMIIRINDPVAEATKAKLLAGIRGVKTETSDILDEEATQHTMQESRQATSRSSRATVTSRRR